MIPGRLPQTYAHDSLGELAIPKIVYRSVSRDTPETFVRWLEDSRTASPSRLSVLVGAPTARLNVNLSLANAYALVARHAPELMIGGIAIAERHARNLDEHQRILRKALNGCRFFITQAVYDVTSTKSMLSDYALAVRERGKSALPIILTWSVKRLVQHESRRL